MEFKKGITMEDAFVIIKEILHEDAVKIKIAGVEIHISDDDCNRLLVEVEMDGISLTYCVYPYDIYATGYDLHIGNVKIKYIEEVKE